MLVVEVALAEFVFFQPHCVHWISRSSSSRLVRLGRHSFPGSGLIGLMSNRLQSHWFCGLMPDLPTDL